MSMVTGIVEAKAKNGKSIMVNGTWFGAFSTATLDDINKGDEVTFEAVTKGAFNNIKGKVNVGATSEVTSTTPVKVVLPIKLDRERSIIRQNALTNAREYVVSKMPIDASAEYSVEEDVKVIIEIAREFEAYTSGEADINAAKKMTTEMEAE